MTSEAVQLDIEKLTQENESLRKQIGELETRLKAAQDLLKDKWKEHSKLVLVFGEAPALMLEEGQADILKLHRPILENAPNKGIAAIAEAVASLGGRATVTQIMPVVKLTRSTINTYIPYLIKHGVAQREGDYLVIVRKG